MLIKNQEDASKFENILKRITSKYENFVSIIEEGAPNNKNCGCMTSHVVISSTGDIKICTMDNMKYFNSVIGNVFENNTKEIYSNNKEYLKEIFELVAPKYDSSECNNCDNKGFCSNCILRGLIKGSELREDCQWYINKVSGAIKKKLKI